VTYLSSSFTRFLSVDRHAVVLHFVNFCCCQFYFMRFSDGLCSLLLQRLCLGGEFDEVASDAFAAVSTDARLPGSNGDLHGT